MENSIDSTESRKCYSVSELNRETRQLLADYYRTIHVEAEISNLSRPASGHIYFSLKDNQAQIRCAMFKFQLKKLAFQPENGQQVRVTAQVSLYEARGDYQLIVTEMAEAGDGDLQRCYEILKRKLEAEGLFASEIKKSIPALPVSIGLITSSNGAALHDLLTVLRRRFPVVNVIIYPCMVQGEQAKFEIVEALNLANQRFEVDLIILARGGGSLEDLWAFNEEIVARAIIKSQIPVISGIGHETDFTIADFVADFRAATPSAAAESAVPDKQHWLQLFNGLEQRMVQQIKLSLFQRQQSVDWLSRTLEQIHPGQKLKNYRMSLKLCEQRLFTAMTDQVQLLAGRYQRQQMRLQKYNPEYQLNTLQHKLEGLNQRLNSSSQFNLQNLENRFERVAQTLNAVSPLATLSRGYAIVMHDENAEIIKSSSAVNVNDSVQIRLSDGQLSAQVKEVIQHET